MVKSPKTMWDVLCKGRYDLMYDLMPLSMRQMSLKKRLNLFKAGRNLVHRRLVPWSWPIHMQIELTNYCNMRCPACPTGIKKVNRRPVAMEVELFEHLMKEVGPYLLTASLWGWGEPLLHPNLAGILRIAQKYPVATLLSTSGQNLCNPEIIEALIKYPPTYLIIAIDGLTDETNSQFRVGAKLEPIMSGVRRLVEMRKQKNQVLPVLHMRYIVMKHNEHEVPGLRDFARENGFDLLTIRTLSTIDMPEQDYQTFIPDAEEFKAYGYANGKRIRRSDFICTEPFWFPSMFADGTVVSCCHDYNAEDSMGVLSLDVSFSDLWFGKQAADVRRRVRDDIGSVSFCRHCPLMDRQTEDASVQAFMFNEKSWRSMPVPGVLNRQGGSPCTSNCSSGAGAADSIPSDDTL